MEIMINIPENIFEELTKYGEPVPSGNRLYDSVLLSIHDGTPLPKGHGRLIDADALVDSLGASDRDIYCKAVIEEDAPTIIEADKGVLEKINEKQDSLRATCKAWDEAIEKDGYVN